MLFINFFSLQTQAQEQLSSRARAEKLFEEFQYAKAAGIYLELTDVSMPRLNDMERLADCYQKMNRYEDAEIWYSRVVTNPQSRPEDLLNLGKMLKSNTRYLEAKKVLQDYVRISRDQSIMAGIAGCDSAIVWMQNPTNHLLKNEKGINTELSEFSVFPMSEKRVYFIGEPPMGHLSQKYGWTGNNYLRIFSAECLSGNRLGSRILLNDALNKAAYHVGPISTNKAGNIRFITRTNTDRKGNLSRVNRNSYRTKNMELYIQTQTNGWWDLPKSFAYNDVQKYSIGHAVLSHDEKVLYYVSNKPGGHGGTDIWYSELQADGSWGKPCNAGDVINTSGDEMFPVIGPDGFLYYSSNGLPGMGELDIFCSKGNRDQWQKPVNMRYPVNSPSDDFSYILNENRTDGYLSSNRINGKGGDDIYFFESRKPRSMFRIEGTVYDKKTGLRLSNANVTLYDSDNTILAKKMSKPDGTFIFLVNKMDICRLKGTKEIYYPDTLTIDSRNYLSGLARVVLRLDPLFEKGKIFKLENIHYNFDK
ncbi:MAG: tetratricopeptide repeat protein, partial [Bacteroidales bacterium]|nr:tetratricopeptide repeat protein [Bacteroidales bacterium]